MNERRWPWSRRPRTVVNVSVSAATILPIALKWARRDFQFNGIVVLFYLCIGSMAVWSATHGSPWSWLTALLDLTFLIWFGHRAHRALKRYDALKDLEAQLRHARDT